MQNDDGVPVAIDALVAFAETMLQRLDVSPDDARLTAGILLEADLRGVESHGMAHLVDFYVRRLQRGEIDPRPDTTCVSETLSAATVGAE